MRIRSALVLVSIPALVGACAAAESESEEDIGQVSSAAGVNLLPDLQITSFVAPAYVEDEVDATVTVCNRGTADAPPSELDLVLSRFDDWSFYGAFGGGSVPALAVSACTTVHAYGLGPRGEADYIGATIDPRNLIAERNETNNLRKGKRIVFGPVPDLTVSSVTGPKDFNYATPVTFTAHVCNRGTDRAIDSRTTFYLSPDAAITSADQWLGSAPTPALDPGACADVPATFTGVSPIGFSGPLYVGAIADVESSVLESNDANNARASALTGYGDGPDLYVSTWSMPTAVSGELTADVTVCNQGFTSSGTDLYFDFAKEPTFDHSDPSFNQTGHGSILDPILPGACVTTSMRANPPGFGALPPGAWYATIEVDSGSPNELLQNNDLAASKEVGVGLGSDEVVRSISAPASVRRGDRFDATFRICNQGTDATPTTLHVTAYLSTDSTITTSDLAEGSTDTAALAAGACRNVIISMSADLPPGTVYVGAIVDPPSGELITTNNSNRRALTITQ